MHLPEEITMPKHLVIVGGGHAHMTVMLRAGEYVRRGFRVTVIGPSPYHYYSGMGPGMLGGIYRPQDIRFHVKKMAEDRGALFLQDVVTGIDARGRTLRTGSGKQVQYDVVSFNTGSDVPAVSSRDTGRNAFTVKPIASLIRARQAVAEVLERGKAEVVVIGGGPAGVETAGNLWRLVRDRGGNAHITLLAGGSVLGGLPERARRSVLASFVRRGITAREGVRADAVEADAVLLSSGERIPADVVLAATGIRPSPIFRDAGLRTGPDGGLLVNRFLQSVEHPEIFGGGDCVSFQPRPLDKVGVYAVRQNEVLYRNLLAALEGGGLTPFHPQKAYMLIFNLGDGTAVLMRRNAIINGSLPWLLKDRIDRSFMRKFQVSGEREEAV